MIYIIVVGGLLVLYFVFKKKMKPYSLNYDTICCFTGGMGSGKTISSVSVAVKQYKHKLAEVRKKNKRIDRFNNDLDFYNWLIHLVNKLFKKSFKDLEPKERLFEPLLYSNIPIKISKNLMSTELKIEHILLNHRIIENSVVFVDELGSFLGQWDYKNPNLQSHGSIEEFFRLFRQYTKGGIFICNDQNIDNVSKVVRCRIAYVYQLQGFKNYLNIFATTNVRHNAVSFTDGGTLNVSSGNVEESGSRLFLWLLGSKKYDTYAYSDRYIPVPYYKEFTFELNNFKTLKYLELPPQKVDSKTNKG